MNQQEFESYASLGYNRVPIVKEVIADLETPLSVYIKLANVPYTYLFESVQGGEKWGRYSIIGLTPDLVIKVHGQKIHLEKQGSLSETINAEDPLAWLENYAQNYRVPQLPQLPRFHGGFVGYFGYEIINYIEPRLAKTQLKTTLDVPDVLLMLSENLIIFDNLHCKLLLITHRNPEEPNAWKNAQEYLNNLSAKLISAHQQEDFKQQLFSLKNINTTTRQMAEAKQESLFQSNFTYPEYEAAINKAKEYIADGDAMQIVLSQRLRTHYTADPLHLYRVLRQLNPSPYMFYLNLDDFYILGSSPEVLVRVEDNKITLRPIAGTRPRGQTLEQDKVLADDLLQDQKELAEHLMLIDLGRNDLGKVSEVGSVAVTEKMIIEYYSHVMHIVSNIVGNLRSNLSAIDVLKAVFPAGTVSGAPKIRAIEIIRELEKEKRGIYAGAIGYFSWQGNLDTTIAIRTAVIKDKTLWVQAGSGIVADSDPKAEYQETLNKAAALIRAATMMES